MRLPAKLLAAGALAAGLVLLPVRPRRYLLERELLIPRPIEEAFAFFEDPYNLAKITPPEMGFEITDVEGLPMGTGTRISYQIRVMGVPQRWVAEIAEYEPGRRFVDVQAKGPYRYWRHEHAFEPVGGHTLMRDRVEYELPFGLAGRLAHVVVARQLRRIFAYRERVIEELFPAQD